MKCILPQNPNELLSIDFYGPLPTAKYGKKFLFVAIDVFSKLTTLYALQKATTNATVKCIFEDYIPKNGEPQAILSDQGTQFTAKTNRELSRFFRTFLPQQHHRWIEWLKPIEGCINEAYHETTGVIPRQLHFTEKPQKPWTNVLKKPADQIQTAKDLILTARNNTRNRRKKHAEKVNSQHKITEFRVGDLVLVKALNVSNPATRTLAKFLPLYEGPYEVKRKINNTSYILKILESEKERGMFHAQNLRPYYH
ncbi:uncharacterized protein [Venturia canescens]|uniref:uncharacterized protein n=1 Tax=Venturia canescens TaxID=32260 RepID=UPI001C9D3248|nr:uncharacterized protein LOC122411369 [Venturia canescens]